MALTGVRTLSKRFERSAGSIDDLHVLTQTVGGVPWEVIGNNAWQIHETFFDLGGVIKENIVGNPIGAVFQRPFEPVVAFGSAPGNAGTQGIVQARIYISTSPIGIGVLRGVSLFPSWNDNDWNKLSYGEVITYDSSTTLGLVGQGFRIPIYSQQIGSGDSFASDRLYCYLVYRISLTGGQGISTFEFPPRGSPCLLTSRKRRTWYI